MEVPASHGDQRSRREFAWALAASTALATLSIWLQGFRFGVSNNVFHIPFLLNWHEQEAFANDAFYQTLPRFTSGLLWLMRYGAAEDTLVSMFLGLHWAARVGTFIALMLILRHFLSGGVKQALALVAVTSSPLMLTLSPIGKHDMLGDYFTHTEVTWPFAIISLYWATLKRWTHAAAFAGLSFFINAFVGLWLAFAIACAMTRFRRDTSASELVKAALCFLFLSLPVIAWITFAIGTAEAPAQEFSFKQFVREYYPSHFLIEAASPTALLNVLAIGALATVAANGLKSDGWRVVIAALLGLLALGIVLPYAVDHRLVFNLHLLRVDGIIVMIAMPLVIAIALRMTSESNGASERWLGVNMLVGSLSGQLIGALLAWLVVRCLQRTWLWIPVAAALAVSVQLGASEHLNWSEDEPSLWAMLAFFLASLPFVQPPSRQRSVLLTGLSIGACITLIVAGRIWGGVGLLATLLSTAGVIFLAWSHYWVTCAHSGVLVSRVRPVRGLGALWLLAICIAVLTGRNIDRWRDTARMGPADRDWMAVVQWFRDGDSSGPVLVPLAPIDVRIDHNFQLHARRPVWVDWKQGAAVLWSPAFYSDWRSRYQAVTALRGPTEFADYALRHRIPLFVVERTGSAPAACPSGSQHRYTNARFAVCAIAAAVQR